MSFNTRPLRISASHFVVGSAQAAVFGLRGFWRLVFKLGPALLTFLPQSLAAPAMSHLPRLTIRPPSRGGGHLQGYVGIPASSSASNGAKPRDPLLDDLPTLTNRPAASLNGIVEVHAASSTAYRVKWLRVELEKIETVPQPVHHGGKAGASGGKKFAEYIELIGEKPEELLGRAGVDIGTGIRGGLSANRKPSGGGRLRPLLGKKDDKFEDGWEILRSGERTGWFRGLNADLLLWQARSRSRSRCLKDCLLPFQLQAELVSSISLSLHFVFAARSEYYVVRVNLI